MSMTVIFGVLQTHRLLKCPFGGKRGLQMQGTLVVWFCSTLDMVMLCKTEIPGFNFVSIKSLGSLMNRSMQQN